MDKKDWNTNILCVDDEEGIIELYKSIFLDDTVEPSQRRSNRKPLNKKIETPILTETQIRKINLYTAVSGEEAIAIMQNEYRKGNRITVGFFDMKMPGGIDGMETIKEIRKIDPEIICVVVTAYMERNIEQIGNIFPYNEQWVLLNKPFSIFELEQLAKNLVFTWNINKEHKLLTRSMEENIQKKTFELHYKLNQLKLVHEITLKIGSIMNLNAVFELTLNEVTLLFNAEIGSIMLIDEESNELVVMASSGPKSKEVVNKRRKIDTTSMTGYSIVHNESIVITNIDEDPRFHQGSHEQQRFECDTFLCAPIVTKEKIIGTMVIGRKSTNGIFTRHELDFLETLARQIGFTFENAKLYESLQNIYINTVTAFSAALEAKDPYTKGHSDRVAEISLMLAKKLGLSEKDCDSLKQVALLHDIGKIGISEEIINKPGKLLESEFDEIKKHPAKGAEIISKINFLAEIAKSFRSHHEKYDGTGYPDGLKEKQIPLFSRIITLADSFDAMTSSRPYRNVLTKNEALAEIKKCIGTHFDPELAKVFIEIMGKENI